MNNTACFSHLARTAIETDPQGLFTQTLLLIVEDDEDDFTLLQLALEKVGITAPICRAQDGAEAIEALSKHHTEFYAICLIVDIHLPDMNGVELVVKLKAKALCSNVIIVYLSGNPNPDLRTRALGCGADAFFLKPTLHSGLVEIAYQLKEICIKSERLKSIHADDPPLLVGGPGFTDSERSTVP